MQSNALTYADRQIIERFSPTTHTKLVKILGEIGISTTHWTSDSDPSECFKWCFGTPPGPAIIMVEDRDLRAYESTVRPCFRLNMRQLAIELERDASDPHASSKRKSAARKQAGSSREVDRLLRKAFVTQSAVHVAFYHAKDNKKGAGYKDEVEFRELDTAPWYVVQYEDRDGSHLLVRSDNQSFKCRSDAGSQTGASSNQELLLTESSEAAGLELLAPEPLVNSPVPSELPRQRIDFVDQFSLSATSRREEVTVNRHRRDSQVRSDVLMRAGGICELCGRRGFLTRSGAFYLETHHVVPLQDEGSDAKWNMAAICPGEHREAHHGERADEIRDKLLKFLAKRYPEHAAQLYAEDRRARQQ